MKPFPETPFTLRTKHAHLSAILHRAPGKKLVIMCHGFTGTKVEPLRLFVQTARALRDAGFNVLRFDFAGSGDSSGEFDEMSPNTQIRDALDVLAWGQRRYRKVAFLGLSLGGGTVICASHQAKKKPDALLTWSSLPGFRFWWNHKNRPSRPGPERDPLKPGRQFWTDLPKVDIPEAYLELRMPRLQIQGSRDLDEFVQLFRSFCPKKDPLVQHLVLRGADHTFNKWKHRQVVIAESIRFLKEHLK